MQKEIFGFNTLEHLEDIINEYNPKKIFLVTGTKSFSISGIEKRLSSILERISYTRFSLSHQYLEISDIKRGIDIFKKNGPDLVIAIGGGSVIDAAKAISILAAQNDAPESYVLGKKELSEGGKTLNCHTFNCRNRKRSDTLCHNLYQ